MVYFLLWAFLSPLQYLFVVLFFLGLAKLLLNGAVEFTEQPHLLTVLQEACRSRRLVWNERDMRAMKSAVMLLVVICQAVSIVSIVQLDVTNILMFSRFFTIIFSSFISCYLFYLFVNI